MRRTSFGALFFLLLSGCSGRGCNKDPEPQVQAPQSFSTPSSVVVPPVATALPLDFGTAALAHLPAGCEVVVRVQWRALAQHPLLAPQLRRWLDARAQSGQGNPEQQAFFEFLRAAKLDPLRDIDQLAACSYPDARTPIVVVAGNLPEQLLPLIKQHAPASEKLLLEQQQGVNVLQRQGLSGARSYALQAEDRALLLGEQLPPLLAARQLSAAHKAYALPQRGEVALTLGEATTNGLLQMLVPSPPGPKLRPLSASFDLTTGTLLLESEQADAETAELLKTRLSLAAQTVVQKVNAAGNAPAMLDSTLLNLLQAAQFEVNGAQLKVQLTLPLHVLWAMASKLNPDVAEPNNPSRLPSTAASGSAASTPASTSAARATTP